MYEWFSNTNNFQYLISHNFILESCKLPWENYFSEGCIFFLKKESGKDLECTFHEADLRFWDLLHHPTHKELASKVFSTNIGTVF